MKQVLLTSFVLILSSLCLQSVSASDLQHRHTALRQNAVRHVHPRAECKTASVESGDSCATLAERCQISATDFSKYNNDPQLCSSLQPGQRVCCSEGVLPDISPRPQLDGSCSTHNVTDGESCSVIAATLGVKATDIDSWNEQTWRYSGCDGLEAGQVICVSEGTPPMPLPLENAICGPQVPGTQKPTDLSREGALSELNPCPLKACCNIWGQCGTTDDYCTPTKLDNGAPGTSAPGEIACISNCGTEIVKSDPPKNPVSIGYFEAFNLDRPCLVMDASQIPGKEFTHIHFAFANISHDYKLQLAGSTAAQWSIFKDISGPKRILSFGGWSFSTSVDSFPIFGKAVSKENRQTFIDSLVQFVSNSGIDGLDFDWEYPGAPDLPGVPPGDERDGERYLEFLKDLRTALPKEKSLSIAAPASYWYLKGFPIAEMAEVLDYIVYMTYDLHGQWDYNNKYSSSGCPKGDCLRSHVNLTETNTALSMITKAGVPSNKVVVGVSSYGRSFEMTESGCTGAMCTYHGPNSTATPGECTQTPGYIANAEIEDILHGQTGSKTFYDYDSNSDIMVYNDTQWVSYMSKTTKSSRRDYYLGLNFLGTVDWAIDLADFASDVEDGQDDELITCNDGNKYHTVDDVTNDKNIPDDCVNTYLIAAMSETMETALNSYHDIMNDGYKGKYDAFVKQVHEQAPLQWDNFYHEKINDFFTCEYAVPSDGGKSYTNHTGGCPPNNIPKEYEGRAYNIFFINKDEAAFCKEIEDGYGLDCSWIEYTSERTTPCLDDNDCAEWGSLYAPKTKLDFPVPDPGATISQALSNYTGLSNWLSDTSLDAQIALLTPSPDDVVDGASTAVFSTQAAVAAMQKVADLGEKAQEAERKEMILLFVSAVFMVLPGLGSAISSIADIAMIARIAALVGEAGNAAIGLYSIAENPESAPMAIMGVLLGGVARRDEGMWAKAGKTRRGMSMDVMNNLGEDVASSLRKVAGARRSTCKL